MSGEIGLPLGEDPVRNCLVVPHHVGEIHRIEVGGISHLEVLNQDGSLVAVEVSKGYLHLQIVPLVRREVVESLKTQPELIVGVTETFCVVGPPLGEEVWWVGRRQPPLEDGPASFVVLHVAEHSLWFPSNLLFKLGSKSLMRANYIYLQTIPARCKSQILPAQSISNHRKNLFKDILSWYMLNKNFIF